MLDHPLPFFSAQLTYAPLRLSVSSVQVTPLLGLLKGLINRAQQEGTGCCAQASATVLPISKPSAITPMSPATSDGKGGGSMPHVYLIYTCRHLDELQVLDVETLEEACRCEMSQGSCCSALRV